MIKSIQFIGTQRSGSNLLRLMLNQHPDISSHHPPHILYTFYPLLPHYGDIGILKNRKMLIKDVCDWVRFNPISWEPIELDEQYMLENTHDLLAMVVHIYLQKAKNDNAKIWCCKSTFNIEYVSELEKRIKPFYLYLYRDGRDVALSFKKAIVGPKHIYQIAKKWAEEQRSSLALIDTLDKSRYAVVKYEELLINPEKTLQNLCSKLGIDYTSDMLQYYFSEESIRTANSGDMWKNVTQPLLANNYEKFKKELSEEEIKIFEGIAGDQLVHLGYSISNPYPITFSSDEIDHFKKENEKLTIQTLENASPIDLEKRKKQDDLLKSIKLRFHLK